MAIDTSQKRASVVGVGRPWIRSTYPNATQDILWRSSVGNIYAINLEPTIFAWAEVCPIAASWINKALSSDSWDAAAIDNTAWSVITPNDIPIERC